MFNRQTGQISVVKALVMFVIAILLVTNMLTVLASTNIGTAISTLEQRGYVVLASGEYSTINTKLDNIKIVADAAVINAEAAVVAAENAVDAAVISAEKIDLFNTAEVFLFPNVTNVTVTLTAGNTNVWSNWVEVEDSLSVTLSSKFAIASGYINDMYIL